MEAVSLQHNTLNIVQTNESPIITPLCLVCIVFFVDLSLSFYAFAAPHHAQTNLPTSCSQS